MINLDTWSPSIRPDLAYDQDLEPSLRGVDILGPGTLIVDDIDGNRATYNFAAPVGTNDAAYTVFPYRLELQIRRVVGDGSGGVGNGTTGTDIALADLVGLR